MLIWQAVRSAPVVTLLSRVRFATSDTAEPPVPLSAGPAVAVTAPRAAIGPRFATFAEPVDSMTEAPVAQAALVVVTMFCPPKIVIRARSPWADVVMELAAGAAAGSINNPRAIAARAR
ncbi:hypothetical protein Ate02nite_96310 [Paractinoplanes tereljensis]|uniref:Uncharacterized protein n=1 Tax=Paractinoplanes tereljensis TaxID=571912 RepID=A0A919TXZ3_9ACTN|nr:hypothetical protein Ate02nite_96310 [Actinoplanes tereljensis]